MPKQDTVRKGYDKIAAKYHKQRKRYPSLKLLEKISRYLKKGNSVLDLGCGAGIPVSKYLFDKGFKVVGIDFSEGMLKLARENVPKASFKKMDMTKMSFKENWICNGSID